MKNRLLSDAVYCECGHLKEEHLYIDKGKKAGERGECQTRGPSMKACCAVFSVRVPAE